MASSLMDVLIPGRAQPRSNISQDGRHDLYPSTANTELGVPQAEHPHENPGQTADVNVGAAFNPLHAHKGKLIPSRDV